MAYRMTEQKGLGLIKEILEVLMRLEIQIAIIGEGDKYYEKLFTRTQKKYPNKIGLKIIHFNTQTETQFFAGSDMLLMPSRFEPFGISPIISSRYGTIPIVHAVGGLADTVIDYSSKKSNGFGFIFKRYHSHDLLISIIRALETYKRKNEWRDLVKKAMEKTFSWEIPAQKYIKIYKKAINLKNKDKKN
jgi:starch synthase